MNETAADTLQTGTRVFVRGEMWTVQSVTSHTDCESVHLSPGRTDYLPPARTFLRPFDRFILQRLNGVARVVTTRRWAGSVLDLLACSHSYGALAAAARARIRLLPFQLEPALSVLRHGHTRVLIADEVGLGKTIQAGILLNELTRRAEEFRGLVLAPAGLREQWRMELAEHFALDAIVADAAWLQSRSRDLPHDVNPWVLPGIYLASLDLVKRPEVLRAIEDVTWDLFVLDEAHAAGIGTARLAAASAIGKRSRLVLLLTATPPDGDPPQMAALGGIGRLEDDDQLLEFRRTRADAGASAGRRSAFAGVRPSGAERRMHRLLDRYARRVWAEAGARNDARGRLVSAILRKRALSSAASLVASISRRLTLLDGLPSTAEQQQLLLPLGDDDDLEDAVSDAVLGAAGLNDGEEERGLLREIEAAAHAASVRESKVCFLLRLLRRAGEPAIVFTEYRDTLAHLERALRLAGFRPLLLHGGMVPRERTHVQRTFNDSGVLLLATDAAAEGLNLHMRCRLVVHFELPWTPARLEQRTGRVDRLGQTRKVHEVMLVSRHTAERTVLAPLLRRAWAARNSREYPGGSLTTITESQITQTMMGGAPPLAALPPVAERFATTDLRDEAVTEATRTARRRRVRTRQLTRNETIVCAHTALTEERSQRQDCCEITLLYLALLEDATGDSVQETAVALRALGIPPSATARAAVRAWAVRLATRHEAECRALVERAARTELDRGIQLHRQVHGSMERRERALARHMPSTAQRLVQAGLFDGRAVRRAEARQRAATLLLQDSEEHAQRADALAPLRVRVKLVAIKVSDGRTS